MTHGIFFAVVGPSGAGKDTLIDYAKKALDGDPRVAFPQRYITRPPDAGGEDHISVTSEEFRRLRSEGAFLLDWQAHGLSYGLAHEIAGILAAGTSVVVNLSRAAVERASRIVEHTHVVLVTAAPETIAARLLQRGREPASDVARRLERVGRTIPEGTPLMTISNDGSVQQAGDEFVRYLRAQVGLPGPE